MSDCHIIFGHKLTIVSLYIGWHKDCQNAISNQKQLTELKLKLDKNG